MRLEIDGKIFRIEWRHRRARKRLAVEAITTCVLIMYGDDGDDEYVAIGIAVCCKGDRFSRLQGRQDSLGRVLTEYRHLAKWSEAILAAFDEANPPKPFRVRRALGSTEIQALSMTPEACRIRETRKLGLGPGDFARDV